jgi:hypothetical protein
MFWRVNIRYLSEHSNSCSCIRIDAANSLEALTRVKEIHRRAQILSYQAEGGEEQVFHDADFESIHSNTS